MKNVLIVDDSSTARKYLNHIISGDPDFHVVGMAANGVDAIRLVQLKQPDIVTMDIHMPVMDGYEATRRIMELHPVPIVIVSRSYDPKEVEKTFRSIDAGAVAVLEKPDGPGRPRSASMVKKLLRTLKYMSDVKLVRRWPGFKPTDTGRISLPLENSHPVPKPTPGAPEIVAIGASTGGPQAIKTLLANLRPGVIPPILIVQHIASGFLRGFVDWLGKTVPIPVRIPRDGQVVRAGQVYFAPNKHQMGITARGQIKLETGCPENGHEPSVSYLFRSVAAAYGNRAVGILLTGMGKDGAMELKTMKQHGAVTIAQDRETSVVHGMPGEAIHLDAAGHVLPPEDIACLLNTLFYNPIQQHSNASIIHGKSI